MHTDRLTAAVEEDLERAAKLLRAGELVAFPTETVYGLGADGLSASAVARIYTAKGRPQDNPVILHVVSLAAAAGLYQPTPWQAEALERLAQAFWPGPLTVVLPKTDRVPARVSAGGDSVAVRVPNHPVALALLAAVDRPLAAPSANRSGRPSPTTADHVLRTLDGRIAAVLDGGAAPLGYESTVLSLLGDVPRILRPGALGPEAISAVLGVPVPSPAGDEKAPTDDQDVPALAPGMRHRHYAPEAVTLRFTDDAGLEAAWPGGDAILCRSAVARRFGPRRAPLVVLPEAPEGFGRALYDGLYALEGAEVPFAWVEALPEGPAWAALRDRLKRAVAG